MHRIIKLHVIGPVRTDGDLKHNTNWLCMVSLHINVGPASTDGDVTT